MGDDPDVITRVPKTQESLEPLAEVISEALLARISAGDRLTTADDARGVAEPIAAAVLDRFAVRPLHLDRAPLPVSRARPADTGVILEVRDLSVAYGAKKAVDGVTMEIGRGEIFGLLGPNGAGKTSTLSAIEGLIKPKSGTVLLDGIDIRRHPAQAKAKMGVQLQATSFQAQLTIKQIVRLYAGLYGVALSDGEIAESLQEIGLGGEAAKPFKQLSGGQQQRLALYIAVVHEPVLLLLDEPTAGLDPQSRRQLWTRIEHLRQEGGSILLTTHSMEEAQAVCDRVAIIDHGTLLTNETPQDLIEKHKDDPRVRAVAHGEVTLEDVFIGLTGSEIRD
jgi:ABC-2 type transport system ATP-binding protein